MATVSTELTRTLGRLRGEQNITVSALATQTNVNRRTVAEILAGKRTNIKPSTLTKLNEWIYKQV